jgi:hypothetical protein
MEQKSSFKHSYIIAPIIPKQQVLLGENKHIFSFTNYLRIIFLPNTIVEYSNCNVPCLIEKISFLIKSILSHHIDLSPPYIKNTNLNTNDI